jgi:hypothetical protein
LAAEAEIASESSVGCIVACTLAKTHDNVRKIQRARRNIERLFHVPHRRDCKEDEDEEKPSNKMLLPPWFEIISYSFLTRFYNDVFIRVFL